MIEILEYKKFVHGECGSEMEVIKESNSHYGYSVRCKECLKNLEKIIYF